MNTPPHSARPRCPRCRLPERSCLCRWVTPTGNQMPLLILQHRLEASQAKGSARLLGLSLQHCQTVVGEVFDGPTLATWLTAPAPGSNRTLTALLLYPTAPGDAERPAVPPATPLPDPEAWRLVLIDGNWRQSRQLLRANPLLARLPRWPLPAPPPSRYAIRKTQRPEQRSTLEAACLALATLEGSEARYQPLLTAFDGWVAEQLRWRSGGGPRLSSPACT